MKDELTNTLMQLQCELVAERNFVNPNDITWLQYDILTALQEQAMLPSELSIYLGLSRSKLSKSLVHLRDLHYIRQTPSHTDRREMITSLTEAGTQLLATIDVGHAHLADIAQRVLSSEEQQQFIQLSQKIIALLQTERGNNES